MLAATHAGWWETFERALLLRDSNTMWGVLGVLAYLNDRDQNASAYALVRRFDG